MQASKFGGTFDQLFFWIFFMKFSQKMPLNFFYTMVQKSQKWPKTQIKGGPALKKKKNRKTGKGNCPPARESGVSRSFKSLKTRPQISMVILGIVWFWRHEVPVTSFLPITLYEVFITASFRRCRPNFLVLQKEYKILVHNLSIYEKLEQSTHWIIQKKWGKDFTFGSDWRETQLLWKIPSGLLL